MTLVNLSHKDALLFLSFFCVCVCVCVKCFSFFKIDFEKAYDHVRWDFKKNHNLTDMVDSISSNSNLNYIPWFLNKFNNLIFFRQVVRRGFGETKLGDT